MTVYYSADFHFFHDNVIRYCNRPFADVHEMNEELVARWNAVVGPEDEAWILGDVALRRDRLEPVSRMNGIKVLVAGNHDDCWDYHKRSSGAVRAYYDAGFAHVVTSGRITTTLGNPEGPQVMLSHLPYRGDSHEEQRYVAQRPVDGGLPLLCGHVHDAWRTSGRQINVGVDVWGYAPVSEYVLRKMIEKMPEAGQ